MRKRKTKGDQFDERHLYMHGRMNVVTKTHGFMLMCVLPLHKMKRPRTDIEEKIEYM